MFFNAIFFLFIIFYVYPVVAKGSRYFTFSEQVAVVLTKFQIDDNTKERVGLHWSGYVSLSGVIVDYILRWEVFHSCRELR
jgi:hypothetical protein